MAVATYIGVVENGRVRLSEDIELKENTQVYVIVPEETALETSTVLHIASPRLADPGQAPLFEKQVIEVKPNAEL